MSSSSSPLARYEAFLISNASTISTIESSLRSLTWFLPGRFKDAELASETRAHATGYARAGRVTHHRASDGHNELAQPVP